MLALRLAAPHRLIPAYTDTPPGPVEAPGSVRLRLLAGAICGSDLAKYRGTPDPRWPHDGEIGFPLHEVVGEVLEDSTGRRAPGSRVVGMSSQFRGLAEEFYADPSLLVDAPADLCDVHATIVQPLATILCSVDRMPDPRGKRVVVIGLGGIGSLFALVLRDAGATVVAVDPVDRSDVADRLGMEASVLATSRGWLTDDSTDARKGFDMCVEAVGHQAQTFVDGVRLLRPGGHLVGFGVPDETSYAVPFTEMFRKQLTIQLGETTNWVVHLEAARNYLRDHVDSFEGFVTDAFDLARADDAFAAAASPRPGQLKVALSADTMSATSVDRGPCRLAAPRRHRASRRVKTT